MCSIRDKLYSSYVQLTAKHTTIFLLNKSQKTIKLTIICKANLRRLLLLFRVCALVLNTISARWQSQTAIPAWARNCSYRPRWRSVTIVRTSTYWEVVKTAQYIHVTRYYLWYAVCARRCNGRGGQKQLERNCTSWPTRRIIFFGKYYIAFPKAQWTCPEDLALSLLHVISIP